MEVAMKGLIIVGVDGSDTAERAAREAVALAVATDAKLHFVTAMTKSKDLNVGTSGEAWHISSHDQAEQLLDDIAQRLSPPGLERSTAVLAGKPAEVICAEAGRVHATMIVVGNARMQGVKRVLGAIASDVAHRAPCSVYIAKTT
ncbi:MAG: universal stress protein [Acidimicrobiia bacterium]|nr:universal stress protein [Acidimicrobiia bacterium]